MASTDKTELLKLPQWQDTDKLEMTDLNDAFEKVDTGLKTHQAEDVSDGVHGIKDIKVVSFGATSTITANSTTHVALSIATPSGYELIGYILDGLYTDSNKSNYYQNLIASVVRSNDPTYGAFVAVRSYRTTDVSVYVAIKGLYIKI